jgi:hypothetical protein
LLPKNKGSQLLKVGLKGKKSKGRLPEISVEKTEKNVRKKINGENQDGDVPSVLAQRRKQEREKAEKADHDQGKDNDGQRQPGIGGDKPKTTGKEDFEDYKEKPGNRGQEQKEEEDDRRFSHQVIFLLERPRKIKLERIVFEVIGDKAGPPDHKNHDHQKKQKISGEIGLEISGIDFKNLLRALDHVTKILDPLGDIDPHEEDNRGDKRPEIDELEIFLLEGELDAQPGDRPPRQLPLLKHALPVKITFFPDGHQSTPTTLAKRSSREV